MPGRTVLILDDDERALLVLRAILETKDLRVLESSEEKTSVEHCELLPGGIEVLIVDVVLHYSDGPAVVQRVKYLQPPISSAASGSMTCAQRLAGPSRYRIGRNCFSAEAFYGRSAAFARGRDTRRELGERGLRAAPSLRKPLLLAPLLH